MNVGIEDGRDSTRGLDQDKVVGCPGASEAVGLDAQECLQDRREMMPNKPATGRTLSYDTF